MKTILRKARKEVKRFCYSVGDQRKCPLCGWRGSQFLPRTNPRKHKYDSICPVCGSLERHRLAYLALKKDLKRVGSTLHFAPEKLIEVWLRRISNTYISGDLSPGMAMKQMDITSIDEQSGSFDLVWCSHVLEHVVNDKKAMKELYRVTRDGGKCVVQVPIWREITYEDSSKSTDEEREQAFYQRDHVRLYGRDIKEKLGNAGFNVVMRSTYDFDPKDISYYSLNHISTNEIFICEKVTSTLGVE